MLEDLENGGAGKMKYYIAIVSGGFKTESILFEETGKVIAFEHGRGANAFDIGVSEATDRIRGTAENLRARLPEGGEISGVFGGISAASFYPEIEQRVAGIFKGAKVKMDSVVNCVMAADLGKDEDGVCLIAGTGSYCCVRRKGMHRHFIGSAGYMLDTAGSGYFLGQQAMIAAQRDRDGRGPSTILTQLVEEKMGESIFDHLPMIYAGGRAYISSFTHVLFSAYRQGDEVAKKIFQEGVDFYDEALQTAYRIMGKPFYGVLGGGVFLHVPEYAEAVLACAPENCTLKVMETPTLYGAALEAMWLTGDPISPEFKSRFLYSYARQANPDYSW